MKEQLYIHLIDGSEAWIRVEVEQLSDIEFRIEAFDDFDPEDTSLIPQFIPGDIVTRKLTKRRDEQFWAADKLLRPSDHKDKKYIEFLYRTVTGDKLKDDQERTKYKEEIERIVNEIRNATFHYPAIINYVKGIQTL
jgi:hypothetical protein